MDELKRLDLNNPIKDKDVNAEEGKLWVSHAEKQIQQAIELSSQNNERAMEDKILKVFENEKSETENKKYKDKVMKDGVYQQYDPEVPHAEDGINQHHYYYQTLPDNRISKDTYYLNIAKEVASRGTCLRRNYGAVIVKNDEIISTGYTGAPRGRANCNAIGRCIRQERKVPSGERYEICRSVHAEMNAIISASRQDMIGATLYLYGWDVENNCEKKNPKPCTLCERMIINSGITKVVTPYETIYVSDLIDHDASYEELNIVSEAGGERVYKKVFN